MKRAADDTKDDRSPLTAAASCLMHVVGASGAHYSRAKSRLSLTRRP